MSGSGPPPLSVNRAKAMLTELLVGFSSKSFQRQLEALVRAQAAKGTQEIWHLEGRKELALSVQSEVLPKYGYEGSEIGVAQMVKAIQPLLGDPRIADLSEGIKQRLRLPSKIQPDSESSDDDDQRPKLKRDKAVALQSELLVEYSAPDFQTRLRSALRRHPEMANQERRRLVREVQVSVLPKYGFGATEVGVEAMRAAFEPWASDPEVLNLSRAIEEQLTACVTDSLAERSPQGATPTAGRIGRGFKSPTAWSPQPPPTAAEQPIIGKEAALEMLKEMLSAFSAPDFQWKLGLLQQGQAATAVERYFSDGCEELALSVQRVILPRYGFEGSRQGVISMICTCSKYASDAEVLRLNDAINEKLGMDMTSRSRFRQRLTALAAKSA